MLPVGLFSLQEGATGWPALLLSSLGYTSEFSGDSYDATYPPDYFCTNGCFRERR